MAHRMLRSRAALALAGVLLLGAGSSLSKPQKADASSPLMDALSRLSPTQRMDYIQGLRGIEEASSSERLQHLDQAQACLAKASNPTAVKGCWQGFTSASQKSRAEQVQQQQALAQRLGLPAGDRKKK